MICQLKKKTSLMRFTGLLLALLMLLFGMSKDVFADDYGPDIFAETYCVINADTMEVIISRDKDRPMYPASTTKVMTALLVLENVEDLDQPLIFTETAINIDPSSSILSPKAQVGECMTVRDALYGMMLASANECAAMLGEFVAGSEAAFAQMMNEKAASLGMENSHFMNAYGIHHAEHYMSAYDLCLILKAAMDNPGFREIMSHIEYTIPKTNMSEARLVRNSHKLLNGEIEEEGILGGKTGSTPQAGKTLVTAAKQEGVYTISALMKSDVDSQYPDEQVLLAFTREVENGSITNFTMVERDDDITASENVNIRYSPTKYGALAGLLETGQTLHRTGEYNGWSRVVFKERTAYVNNAYLTMADGSALLTTEEPVTEEPTTEEPTTEEPATETPTTTEVPATEAPTEEPATEAPTTALQPEKSETVKGRSFTEILRANLDIILICFGIAALITVWVLVFLRRQRMLRRREALYKNHGE